MKWLDEFEKKERFEELSNRFGTIPGWTPDEAGYALYCCAKYLEVEGECVEIGSWKGRSTCWIAEGDFVTAIDTFDGGEMLKDEANGSTFDEFIRNIESRGLYEKVKAIKWDSSYTGKWWNAPVKMLFIDGNHTYEGLKKDWEAWRKHLVNGAVVFFDDVGGNYAGAQQYFEEQNFNVILTIGNMKAIVYENIHGQ